jgi:hypothetical protein
MKGKIFADAAQDAYKMGLEGLNCFFRQVSLMVMWWDKLDLDSEGVNFPLALSSSPSALMIRLISPVCFISSKLVSGSCSNVTSRKPAESLAPNISAYAYLWGQHDYNSNPFAPLGCKVEAHVTPGVQETWTAHTVSGYYTGNAWEHYRYHEVYISTTKSMCTCETVFSGTNTSQCLPSLQQTH